MPKPKHIYELRSFTGGYFDVLEVVKGDYSGKMKAQWFYIDIAFANRNILIKHLKYGNIFLVNASTSKKGGAYFINGLNDPIGFKKIKQEPLPPNITGKVSYIKNKIIGLNVGSKNGVKVGLSFTIYRENSYIGKLKITKVHEIKSHGLLITKYLNNQNMMNDN